MVGAKTVGFSNIQKPPFVSRFFKVFRCFHLVFVCFLFEFLVGSVGMGRARLRVSLVVSFVASSERGRASGCWSRDTSTAWWRGWCSSAGWNLDARAGRWGTGRGFTGRLRNDADVGIQVKELLAGSTFNVVPPVCFFIEREKIWWYYLVQFREKYNSDMNVR